MNTVNRPFEFKEEPITNFYKLNEDLGGGSFSIVKSATDLQTKKEVAVKIVPKKNTEKDEILNEISIWQRFDHENIVKLYDIYETHLEYYLVMEKISGGELFDSIVDRVHYSEDDASLVILQIIKALIHIHDNYVIHRDLKPENLMLSDNTLNATIKVVDFGLATKFNEGQRFRKAVGTPNYIAPEVLRTFDGYSYFYQKEIDIWTLGIISYILLCGFPPFYTEDEDEVFDLIKSGDFSFPSPWWDNISDEAKDWIRKILVIDPKKRMTLQEAIDHEWLKNITTHSKANLASAQIELKKFNAKKKWRNAIMATIASGIF